MVVRSSSHQKNTAAAIAIRDGLTPRGVYESRLTELRQALLEDDCYLPWAAREIPELSRSAKLTGEGDVEVLRNGKRQVLTLPAESEPKP